jgi:hypothetical protein
VNTNNDKNKMKLLLAKKKIILKKINKSDKKRFCFSLDNTLFTDPLIKHNYLTVKPIIKNIEYLKFLKNLGNYIIIYTSRGMDIHNGNIGVSMTQQEECSS